MSLRTSLTLRVHGAFDVKMTPQPADDAAGGAALGRLLIDKRYHGDLDATSVGQMLAHRTTVDGSAGYVALELVTGTLRGKRGSFVLQHFGIMDRGAKSLSVTVVPDSGTGELVGISGRMDIEITDGKHSYDLEYST